MSDKCDSSGDDNGSPIEVLPANGNGQRGRGVSDFRQALFSQLSQPSLAVDLQLWEFDRAPHDFKQLIPLAFAGGWVVYIKEGSEAGLIAWVVARCRVSGYVVVQCDLEAGGVVLAGRHLPD
jgi:hypothetical protein